MWRARWARAPLSGLRYRGAKTTESNNKKIYGKKVILRAMEPSDCEIVREMFNDPDIEKKVVEEDINNKKETSRQRRILR